MIGVDDISDIEAIKNMFEDPFINKNRKRSDIVFTNTLNNPLNRNFTVKEEDCKTVS